MSMAISGMGASAMPQAMTGASMRMPPSQKMSNLFDQIDTSGSGTISKQQFEQAFQSMNPSKGFQKMGADAVWAKLDPNGTGSVSKQDFVNNMASMMSQMRHHHHGQASAQSAAQTVGSSMSSLSSLGGSGSNVNTSA